GVFESSLGTSNVGAAVALPIFGMPATTSVSVFGKLGFVAQDGQLRAFDTSNNGIVWTAALPSGVTGGSAPAVDPASGNVFITVARPAPVLIGFDANGIKNC